MGIKYLGEVKLNPGDKVKAIGYKKGINDIYLKEFILHEANQIVSESNLCRLMDTRANGVNKLHNKILAETLKLNRNPVEFVANSLSDSGNWTLKSADSLTWTYSSYGDFTQSYTVKKLTESNTSYDWYYIWHDNYQLAGCSKYGSSYQNELYYHKMNASAYSNQQFYSARPNNTGININGSATLGVSATGASGSVTMGISTADTTITNNCDPASKYAAWTVNYTRGTAAAMNTHNTETTYIIQKTNAALPFSCTSENNVTWENSVYWSVTKSPGYSHYINS